MQIRRTVQGCRRKTTSEINYLQVQSLQDSENMLSAATYKITLSI